MSAPITPVRLAVLTLMLAGCGATPPVAPADPTPDASATPPTLSAPRAFAPPIPQVLTPPNTPPIWFLDRSDVPLVAIHIVIPYGAASDTPGKGGLAALTAEMMEQGAGRRSALEIGQAAERLGAEIAVDAGRDASSARLVVLAENLEPALALLADVVARPRLEDAEWARTHPLWRSGLESRKFDPKAVAGVVAAAAIFGPDHPYGHPRDGTVESVDAIELDDVKQFHRTHWRPDRATVVVAGAVDAGEIGPLLAKAFIQWAGAGEPPPLPAVPADPAPGPRTVLVERADSAQTVLIVAEAGPAASDPLHGPASLVNIPLGGSFTSRLNQNLREDKGYTYGARSRVPFNRGTGMSMASAAVQSKVTGPALKELRAELARIATGGITGDEVAKAKATARAGDVEAYETVADTADRLAALAGLGLPPDFDARLAKERDALGAERLPAAIEALPSADGTLIAVGDSKVVEAAIEAAGLPAATRYDTEGRPQ